jgi:hypothetical protein
MPPWRIAGGRGRICPSLTNGNASRKATVAAWTSVRCFDMAYLQMDSGSCPVSVSVCLATV